MFTRPLTFLTLSLVLVAALAGQSQAQTSAAAAATPPAGSSSTKPEGIFTIGAVANDLTGEITRVGEYEAFPKAGATLNAQLWGQNGTLAYDLFANYGGDARDQQYGARLVGPRIKANFSFDRFLHRLDHDPLSYVGASIATFVVRADDWDPTAKYATTNGIWKADVDIAATKNIHFFASHRVQMQDGAHQVMATSHCANCHINAFTRKIDQTTQELAAGARVNAGRFTADYTFEHRTFQENAPGLTYTYDNAVHPQTLADVFLNRVSYDDGNGALPIDRIPKFTKQTNTIRAAYALPGDGAISGNFTQSSSKNDTQGFGADYVGASGRVTFPLGKQALVKAYFRKYEIDVDSVFVDVGEPAAPAGPAAGLTYAQAYPAIGTLDYTTESTAARTPTEVALELSFRPSKHSSVNVGYMYEQVNRPEFMVEKTVTNRFKASAFLRPSKALSLRARFDQSNISDPFANLNGAKPAILQPGPTPGGVPFPGLQYFQMYDARTVDLSGMPTRTTLVEGAMTWSPGSRASLSAHYRYRTMKNDTLTGASWDHQLHMPGVDLWIAPSDRFVLSAGWGYQKDTLDTAFSTLNFVG